MFNFEKLSLEQMEPYVWFLIVVVTIKMIKSTCDGAYFNDQQRLEGKQIIVTGANSGIGYETALELANRGANVVLACRDIKRGKAAEESICYKSQSKNVHFVQLDLASFDSIRNFVNTMKKKSDSVYALVNNAGVFWCPFMKTRDGFELNFGVNHLGHFLLTILLLPLLDASKDGAKVVTVSSIIYVFAKAIFDPICDKDKYNFVKAYSESKLANMMFMSELSRKLRNKRIKTYCVDPGIVWTNIGGDSFLMSSVFYKVFCSPILWLLFKSACAAAQTTIYCICSDDVKDQSGKLYCECEQRYHWPSALSQEGASGLWKDSLNLVQLSSKELKLVKRSICL